MRCGGALQELADKTNFSTNPSYTTNLALTYGNIVKGSFVGPQFVTWDTSIICFFPIHESLELQFRAESSTC